MAYNPPAPLTPRQQRAEALALLRAALLPERQQVKRARLEARRQAAEAQARETGLAKALAELQRGIGPATLQGYQGAAQTQGELAKGFSDAIRTAAQADASAAAQTLPRLGAPSEQIQQVSDVGKGAADVTYALGGYIPGRSFAEQGAALSAAQNQLPATTLGRGQQAVSQLQRALQEQERDLDERLADLEAKAPGTLEQILQQIRQNEQAKVATGIQAEYLGLAGEKSALDQRATVADITGIDPVTGLPTAETQGGLSAGREKRQEARLKALSKKNAAFRSARQDALGLARTLWKGEMVQVKDKLMPQLKRPTWAEARQQLWTEIGPDLLRFGAGKAGRRAVQRQVYNIIDKILLNQGWQKPPSSLKRRPGHRVDKPRG